MLNKLIYDNFSTGWLINLFNEHKNREESASTTTVRTTTHRTGNFSANNTKNMEHHSSNIYDSNKDIIPACE